MSSRKNFQPIVGLLYSRTQDIGSFLIHYDVAIFAIPIKFNKNKISNLYKIYSTNNKIRFTFEKHKIPKMHWKEKYQLIKL